MHIIPSDEGLSRAVETTAGWDQISPPGLWYAGSLTLRKDFYFSVLRSVLSLSLSPLRVVPAFGYDVSVSLY